MATCVNCTSYILHSKCKVNDKKKIHDEKDIYIYKFLADRKVYYFEDK